MATACDIDKPIGYWVQQTRSNGETIAVKVLYPFLSEQSDRDGNRTSEMSVNPTKTA